MKKDLSKIAAKHLRNYVPRADIYDVALGGNICVGRKGKMFRWAYSKGAIPEEQVDYIVSNIIFNIARDCYDIHAKSFSRKRHYLDHLNGAEKFFAYALDKDYFSEREIKKMNFGHGEDVKSFIKNHGSPRLEEQVKKRLLGLKE